MNDGSSTRAVMGEEVLESVCRMFRLWLIASHGKPFQNLAQTTSCWCLSGIRTLRWSVTLQEDAPTSPKQNGLFHKCLNDDIHAALSVGSLSKCLEAFCNLRKAVPIKMACKREIPWMNAQLKQLIEKGNKLGRDLITNRKQWLETNRVITRLTEEFKWAI